MGRWMVAAGAVLAWMGAAQAAPLAAYGELPTVENAAISPNGQAIAYATGMRRLAVTAPHGTVLAACERHNPDGRMALIGIPLDVRCCAG